MNFFEQHADIIDAQRIRFDAVAQMTKMVSSGDATSLIVSGPAGVGKTFGVTDTLERLKVRGDVKEFDIVKGYARPSALYALLYKMRKPGQVLVIDDCDSVFRDEDAMNLLKAALDSSKSRTISWRSRTRIEIEDDYGNIDIVPHKFDYEGSVIFLTNLDFDQLIEKNNKMAPHFEALTSRSHYIDIGIDGMKEKFLRVADVAVHCGMFKQMGLSEDTQKDILQWMLDNKNSIREMSLRMAKKLADLANNSNDNWRTIAGVTCVRRTKGK